jgi:hypothetical protein
MTPGNINLRDTCTCNPVSLPKDIHETAPYYLSLCRHNAGL